MSLERETRTAMVARYRPRQMEIFGDGKTPVEFDGFALFEHPCFWGPSFAVRHGESGCPGVKVSAEMCRIPRPRLVCAHGFLSTKGARP